jgi:hypothetical protein
MEVVNLRCDGHHSGSNPDRRVKPASHVFVVYDFILYEFSDLFYSLSLTHSRVPHHACFLLDSTSIETMA